MVRLPPQSPDGRDCVYFFFSLVCLCCYVFSPGPTQYIFHTPMARYSLYVLKVPLNTNQLTNILRDVSFEIMLLVHVV